MSWYKTNALIRIRPAFELDDPGFVIEEPYTKSRIKIAHPSVFSLLADLEEWIRRDDAVERLVDYCGLSVGKAEQTFERFVEYDVLIERGTASAERIERWESMEEAGWGDAYKYHLATQDYPFVDLADPDAAKDAEKKRMQAYKEREPVPDRYRTYPEADRISLPAVSREEIPPLSLSEVTGERNRRVDAGRGGVDLDRLADVLFVTFGETGRHSFPVQGEFLQKTSPSGGSRHPTEAYLIVNDVEELPAGICHYSVKEHALERLSSGSTEEVVEAVTPDGKDDAAPAVAIVFTAVVERNMWRYREPRTFRVIYYDLGHLVQTLQLCASAHDLSFEFTTFVPEKSLLAALPVDPVHEPITGVGVLS